MLKVCLLEQKKLILFKKVINLQIKREQIVSLLQTISILEKNENFSLITKYKILKIKEILIKESEYNSILLKELVKKYGRIEEDGSIYIKQECLLQAETELTDFNNEMITLPDLQFTLDEFNNEISWSNLEALLPFIRE